MEPTTKRTRSTNWGQQEKTIFRRLVLERAAILESKETTTCANTAKKASWKEVLSCFNAVSPIKRDMPQLLAQWRNMKNRAKNVGSVVRRRGRFISARNMTRDYESPSPRSPPREDRELIEAIPNETEESKPLSESPVPVQPEGSQMESHRGKSSSSGPQTDEMKRIEPKPECCNDVYSHEHQLFLLDIAAREQAMQHEEEAHERKMEYEKEIHQKRMAMMALEEENLRLKIAKRGVSFSAQTCSEVQINI